MLAGLGALRVQCRCEHRPVPCDTLQRCSFLDTLQLVDGWMDGGMDALTMEGGREGGRDEKMEGQKEGHAVGQVDRDGLADGWREGRMH